MMPVLGNPAGLWVLLGLPAIAAIHFLQQRARVARTSTWFLIEKLAPDSARGRTWDRLRSSRTLWLQLLAIVLAAWVLAEPRWVRTESVQTIVLVFDASASMDAFRAPAMAAASREMRVAEGLAARTTWIVMTTNPRQPPLYRGAERDAANAAFARWQPELGRHDFGPALRVARNLAGASGRTLLITDARNKVPPDQRAVGVGTPIENVGFAGATVTREEGGVMWRAFVKNHALTPQQRTWQVETANTQTTPQPIALAPGALVEISARFPEGADRATVVLSDDGFGADNRLPLIAPKPKPLTIAVDGEDEAAEFFRKIARAVDGVSLLAGSAPGAEQATLRIAQLTAADLAQETRGGIFRPLADRRAEVTLLNEPVVAERDPLVAGLNWQGWLGTGPYGFRAAEADTPLLWHGRYAMAFLRMSPAASTAPVSTSRRGRKLMLAFDWNTSNAARLPATVLLVRRFLEAERDAQRAPYAANFDCGAPVALTGVPLDGNYTLTFEAVGRVSGPAVSPNNKSGQGKDLSDSGRSETRVIAPAERASLRAPGRPGFFVVKRDAEEIVRGTAQFADARQGDFRAADKFSVEVRNERHAALERNTTPDPLAVLWLVLLAAVALWSWWSKTRSPATSDGGGVPSLRREALVRRGESTPPTVLS